MNDHSYFTIDNIGLLIAAGMVVIAAGISVLMKLGVAKSLIWSMVRSFVQLLIMGIVLEYVIRQQNVWLVVGLIAVMLIAAVQITMSRASMVRSFVQLLIMGIVLEYVIRQQNVWLVVGLIAVMLIAAVQITMSRAKGVPKGLVPIVLLSLVVTMLIMISIVAELIVRPHPWYAPQVVIPLTGMMLGNTVSALALAMSRFFESMRERYEEVGTLLALGATPWEAARPSIMSSIRLGMLPTIANLASAGIVTIPGMMSGQTLLALGATPWEAARPSIMSSIRLGMLPTIANLASAGIVTIPGMMSGQVIAGGNPLDAARYQFVILTSFSALTLLAGAIILALVYKRCFISYDRYLMPVH